LGRFLIGRNLEVALKLDVLNVEMLTNEMRSIGISTGFYERKFFNFVENF
jgi:hypothetical protein